MRDYSHIERYLNILVPDVYLQPPDPKHERYTAEVIEKWLPLLIGLGSVLDVGCGQGFAMGHLSRFAPHVEGVTLGTDYDVCLERGLVVHRADMSFLPFEAGSFDLVFARHSLEHSPMPLLTLMEWHRVSKQWLLLVVPNPAAFAPGGRNHYYVLNEGQWLPLLARAGWHVIWQENTEEAFEYRFMCEKVKIP